MTFRNSSVATFPISIHAPTRGATPCLLLDIFCTPYFNPRSHEGSDRADERSYKRVQKFQSTLPRGERHRISKNHFSYCNISIHAPTRGATASPNNDDGSNRFQSTLPRGERQSGTNGGYKANYFNPRSHEGSDFDAIIRTGWNGNFNPRSHEGSDCNID